MVEQVDKLDREDPASPPFPLLYRILERKAEGYPIVCQGVQSKAGGHQYLKWGRWRFVFIDFTCGGSNLGEVCRCEIQGKVARYLHKWNDQEPKS